MNTSRAIQPRRLWLIAVPAIVAIAALLTLLSQPVSARTVRTVGPKPTIVLVHGAWADSGAWEAVTRNLHADGYTVYALPNPLQGLTYDAAYLTDFLHTISGPIVLVGHSYGGAVITNAATATRRSKPSSM